MLANGDVLLVPPPFEEIIGPVIRLSRVVSDGKGNLTVTSNASYNGYILTEPFEGTYVVSPDCRISFLMQVPLPVIIQGTLVDFVTLPFQFDGALGDSGTDALATSTSVAGGPPGNSVRVHLHRMDGNYGRDTDGKLACTNRSLTGTYQLDLFGEVIRTSEFPWPTLPFDVKKTFTRSGNLTFDGKGAFSGNTIAIYAGQAVVPESLSGTYSIDPTCNVTIHYTLGPSYTWLGLVKDGGNGANLLVTAPTGAAISGTLLKQ